MLRFAIDADDQNTAYINLETICIFRVKTDDAGGIADHPEVEIEFIGGTKTRLLGDSALHFIKVAMENIVIQ